MKKRSPERDKAMKLYLKSGKTMKTAEIAEKLGVSYSLVGKWKSQDKWDSENLPNNSVKSNKTKSKNGKKRGGQKGNINAVGNSGGAPLGNIRALKHGGYSAVYWDNLDEQEKELIADIPKSEEELLADQIKLYTVRERRILLAIKKVKEAKGEQVLDKVVRSESKYSFGNDAQREKLHREVINNLEESAQKIPGDRYDLQTSTESKTSVILRLEAELSKVQRAKNQAIDSLIKLHLENQKLELLKEENTEVEDTDETDEEIYGSK